MDSIFALTKTDSNAQVRYIESHGSYVCSKQHATGTEKVEFESYYL